jgi:hypothetical protein
MTSAYRGIAHLIAGCIALQAAFIAFGMFGLRHYLDDGGTATKDYDGNAGWALHSVVGMIVIPLLAVALVVVAVLAKHSDGIKAAAVIAGLVIVQVAFGVLGEDSPWIGALHGLLALVLMGIAVEAGVRVGRSGKAVHEPPATR